MTRSIAFPLQVFALVVGIGIGCAGQHESRENLLSSLRNAMQRPVETEERSRSHGELVRDVVESDVLLNMRRHEVADAIGAGDACSRHPRCAELGFKPDDWFYHVGQTGGARIPILIVGFDSSGHVTRAWYTKTQ